MYFVNISHASVCQHLITVRLQSAEGVPPENSQRHSLVQKITLTLILKSHGKSATQIIKKLDRRFFPWRRKSKTTVWKMRRRPDSAYLAIFLTSAESVMDPAASADRIRFEDANVLTPLASQMRQRPRE